MKPAAASIYRCEHGGCRANGVLVKRADRQIPYSLLVGSKATMLAPEYCQACSYVLTFVRPSK
jgi:hypothetical protein